MPSAEYDIRFVEEGIESLETYLTSNALFWPIHAPTPSGDHGFPRLTIGGFILAIKRIETHDLENWQLTKYRSLEIEIKKLKNKWRDAWERKAYREFSSRVRQWSHYLEDIRHHPEKHEVYYPSEVRVRVIIDLLIPELDGLDAAFDDMLVDLDSFLKHIFVPGEFIWEDNLAKGFNSKEFWYLWGIPNHEESLQR